MRDRIKSLCHIQEKRNTFFIFFQAVLSELLHTLRQRNFYFS